MIKRNFQWTKCFMSIPLSKGVYHIIEVTMTLAKIQNFVLAVSNISKLIGKVLLIVLSQHHFIEVPEAT